MIVNLCYLELIFTFWNIFQQQRLMENIILTEDFIFEEKRQEALENKLHFEFIRINTSKENYDADYEGSRIPTFISKFKDK